MNDTIVVPADFTYLAENAAQYALQLAQDIDTPVIFCNALKNRTLDELIAWAAEISAGHDAAFTCDPGNITGITGKIHAAGQNPLIVIGMAGEGHSGLSINGFDIAEKANCPVLLVPEEAGFTVIKKIAFATDLNTGDLRMVFPLAHLAAALNAEIQIAHIKNEKFIDYDTKHKIDAWLVKVREKANYANIHYSNVRAIDVEHGLNWLSDHSLVDMLAMAHHHHPHLSVFNKLFGQTEKFARHTRLPLLIMPTDNTQL